MDGKYVDVLVEDFFNKKMFSSKGDFACAVCGRKVARESAIYFFGDNEKMCSQCKEEICEQLEEMVKTEEYKETRGVG